MIQPSLWACSLCLPILAGCVEPTLRVDTPPPTRILIDGDPRPAGVARPVKYYGTVVVEALPPAPGETAEARPPGEVGRREVTVSPPMPEWLFPFDFFGELFTAPWREWDTAIEVEAIERPPLTPGIDPPGTIALRARAREARTER